MWSSLKRHRPFSTAGWAYLLVIAAFGMLMLLNHPCAELPVSFGVSVLTAAIFTVLWANHIRVLGEDSVDLHRLLIGATTDFILLAFFAVLVAFPLTAIGFAHATQCLGPRMKVTEMFLVASPLRDKISQRVADKKTVRDSGLGLQVVPSGRVKAGHVSLDGAVVLAGDDPPAVIVMTPSLDESGQLQWNCKGYPSKIMPASCR